MSKQKVTRTQNVAKNIIWGYVSTIVSMILQFVSRSVFIYTIGMTYMGINGVFSNILGILSFTDLGIGTVLNFSLYKPIAENDREKIKSLMQLYKRAYHIIAIIITAFGIIMVPFLKYFANGAQDIDHLYIYYYIYLFNTVSSYFITYKYGLVNASQKGYLLNNINTIFNGLIVILQIISLIIFRSFFVYLTIQSVIQLIQKIYTSNYIDKKYTYLKEKNIEELDKQDKDALKNNVAAMVYHKLGSVLVNQTDNLIISATMNVIVVAKISNYNMLITVVSTFTNIIFNSFLASLGDYIASEKSVDKRKKIFQIYSFLAFWIYGFITIAFIVLVQPFITIWLGKDKLIDNFSMFLIMLNVYSTGMRVAIANFKSACGIFQADKYIGIIQSVVNLLTSIIFAKLIGLPGVYIGTTLCGMVDTVWRPFIVYKLVFNQSPKEYFLQRLKYLIILFFTGAVSVVLCYGILKNNIITGFIASIIIVIFSTNFIFWIIYHKTEKYLYIKDKFYYLLERRKELER